MKTAGGNTELNAIGAQPRPDGTNVVTPIGAGTLLRVQVLEIIQEVLGGTCPEQAEVRARLRTHVEGNPGAPERAILKHLMTR